MKNSISIFFLALVLAGCEKKVDLVIKGNQSKIVIEGNITNENEPHLVKITKSIPLKETGAYPTVDNAIVTISDDAGNSETLTPQGNGTYSTATLAGVEGRTYTLSVVAENQTYMAQSTMPQQVPFDTIKVEEVTMGGEIERNLIPIYTDPVVKGNNYRFVLSINDKLVKQHLIQNDEVKNGTVNTFKLEINDDDLKLKSGDLATVKMQCIDANVALFFTSLALMADSGPGGGTTPSNPPNNFSNGALGVFSSHTIQIKTVTIP